MKSKADLRRELLDKRDRIPPEVRRSKDRLALERLMSMEEFRKARIIFSFVSFRTEVDTLALIAAALSSGKTVFVPKVDRAKKILLLCEIKNPAELRPGYMGIPEPVCEAAKTGFEDIDVVIIPGAGFDPSGNRIGYGGGYYDRLLADKDKHFSIIAPAFEEQVEDMIPAEPHDIKVDLIVTDRRVIRCGI